MEPIRLLSREQMEQIDMAAREILARTGMIVRSQAALELLAKFGCEVDRPNERVRFPRDLTAHVVEKMRQSHLRPSQPERMPVRYSHVRFKPTPHQVHQDFTVSAGGFVPFIYDLDGQRRRANGQDVLCSINMVNHLGQINLTGLPVSDQDVPPDHRPVLMACQLARYTRKLGGIETFSLRDVRYIHELAMIVAGSEQEFRRNPRIVGYAEVRSPLCFDRNMIDIFMEYVRMGIPQTVDTMPCGGTTAPITLAGILALGAAETIAPMALAYAVRDDAIVGMDINPSYADMSSGLYRYSGSERLRLLMARIQLLSEYYGCPTGVHGGKTDGCFLNEQAGAEKMSSMLLAVLAGAVGFGTVGAIENAVTFSPTQLVLDDAMAGYVRHAIKPVEVNAQTLATELIESVGPGGNFLSHDNTADNFRSELLLSSLFPAHAWEAAHSHPELHDATRHAAEMARALWQPPEAPVLSDAQLKAVDELETRYEREN